jgi:TatA/E family protein of Tat protein translocase
MFGLGFGELLIIFLIALIFIGPKKLPELAKGLGQGIREFQKAAKGLTDQLQDNQETQVKPHHQHDHPPIVPPAGYPPVPNVNPEPSVPAAEKLAGTASQPEEPVIDKTEDKQIKDS